VTQQARQVGSIEIAPVETLGRPSVWSLLAPWRNHPLGVFGAVIIVVVFLLAFIAPQVAPNDPKDFVGKPLEHPSREFLLGTNNLGQDVFSRTLYGTQVSVAVGLSATLLSVVVGTTLGIVSGYAGGWVDLAIQRLLEVLASFPGLFLALLVMAAIGRPKESGSDLFALTWQLRSLEIAVALAFIFGNMRVIRSAVIKQRGMPFIEAANSIGVPLPRVLFRHILPNVFPYVIVAFSTIIGIVILIEAALSFLGYGVEPGTASWGADLSNRNREFFLSAPWLILGPAVALSLTVMGFNFLGDALRDILDPRLRGTR
jgi:peptide/nickel transport system permease protein